MDIGAGTGIATALLKARGARVLAVEPGDGMAAQSRRALPDAPLLRGDGTALPLATASDFLTHAQARHWTATSRSVLQALCVLRPGGARGSAGAAARTARPPPFRSSRHDREHRVGRPSARARGGSGRRAGSPRLTAAPARAIFIA